jgi:RNA polymerase sigma-70 factor (ECF subfamily)
VPDVLVARANELAVAEDPRTRLTRMFNEHHDFIWRLLRRLGVSTEKADDATQHVFLVATEKLAVIKNGSERAFLFGTAMRVARMHLRTERRWVLEEDMDLRGAAQPKVEDLVQQRRALQMMEQVLSQMDLELRTVFILFELEGLTTPEIATLAEIPLGTAASRLRRAREAFRTAVAALQSNGTQPEAQACR